MEKEKVEMQRACQVSKISDPGGLPRLLRFPEERIIVLLEA